MKCNARHFDTFYRYTIKNLLKIIVIIITIWFLNAKVYSCGLARWALSAQETGEMSIRAATHRLIQNGRVLLRTLRNKENLYSNDYPKNYLNKIHVVQVGELRKHIFLFQTCSIKVSKILIRKYLILNYYDHDHIVLFILYYKYTIYCAYVLCIFNKICCIKNRKQYVEKHQFLCVSLFCRIQNEWQIQTFC